MASLQSFGLRFVSIGLLCALALSALSCAQTDQPESQALPSRSVDVSAFGFHELSAAARFTRTVDVAANLTVHFVDTNHILFTFNPKTLINRRPECPPTHTDRNLRAVVLDLRDGKAVAVTDWYVHDDRPYLSPLGHGHFLLRRLNSLYDLGPDLTEKLLLESPKPLLWANVTPDGKDIVLATAIDNTASTQPPANPKARQPKANIEFRDFQSLTLKAIVQEMNTVPLHASSAGFADVIARSGTWLIRFGPTASERKYLVRVKSPCRPDLLFPTNETLFVGRCSSKTDDYSVSVFTITGHPLWRDRWKQMQYVPTVERSEDGGRIALSTVLPSATNSAPSPDSYEDPGWPSVEQNVRVLETASGALVASIKASTVVLRNTNYALSPDGTRLALLDGTHLNIYDLKSPSDEERAQYLAMKSDAPALAAPLSHADGDDEAEAIVGMPEPGSGDEAPTPPLTASANAANPPQNTNAAAGARDKPQILFKARTQEVALDVVVTDSKHHPVRGLTKEDFQVDEDGKPQKLGYFREFAGTPSTVSPSSSHSADPNVFTNNIVVNPELPVVVVVLDLLNTPFADQHYGKNELLKFLKNKPRGMQFALCSLSDRLRVIQGLTSDENQLMARLSSNRGLAQTSANLNPDPQLSQTIIAEQLRITSDFVPEIRQHAQTLANFGTEEQSYQMDRRVALTMSAFSQLARYLSAIPGRKSLLWLSGGFPAVFFANMNADPAKPVLAHESRDYSDRLRLAMNLLAQAHVSVYPVDVRGIASSPSIKAENTVLTDHDTMMGGRQLPPKKPTSGPLAPPDPQVDILNKNKLLQAAQKAARDEISSALTQDEDERNNEQSTMDQLATDTGGKAFYDSNGVQQAIATAIEQASHYYSLSYVPPNRNFDGSYRKIKINLARKGYHLSYRRGYFAVDPQAPSKDSSTISREVAAAMQFGSPQSHQILVAAQVAPVGKFTKVELKSEPGNQTTTKSKTTTVPMQHYSIDYAISGSQLSFVPSGNTYHALLDFMVVAFDGRGNLLAKGTLQITGNLDAMQYKNTLVAGMRMHQEIDVPLAATSLRLAVGDEINHHLGTLDIPLPLNPLPDEYGSNRHKLPPVEPD